MIALPDAENYMRQCIETAKIAAANHQYALASMIVDNGKPINNIASELVSSHDPTAHPEIMAIRDACAQRKSRYLQGCILVSTHEPCAMCASAAIWAKMDGIIFGLPYQESMKWAKDNPHPRFTWRQIELSTSDVVSKGTPTLWVMGSVLEQECQSLLTLNT